VAKNATATLVLWLKQTNLGPEPRPEFQESSVARMVESPAGSKSDLCPLLLLCL